MDGKLYGLPQEFNCEYGGVLVNKTMYENAGPTYPPKWETMDDVLADAQVLFQVDDAYARAQARGYVPFVTVRSLGQLIINKGHEPD